MLGRSLVALLTLLLSGCGYLKTTPAQDRVYTDFEACKTATSAGTAHLTMVTPEGRFGYDSREGDFQKMQLCLEGKGHRFR